MSTAVGYYATLPLTQCIASAKMQLRIEVSDDDVWFEKLANEAARHMDSLTVFVKRQCQLAIVDGKAKLPNGFYRMLGLRLGGGFNGASLFYVDTPFLSNCGINNGDNTLFGTSLINGSVQNGSGTFQIQNGYIYFATGISMIDPVTKQVTYATSVDCAFIGLNVDDNGLMIVREDMERGIVAYICYMYMLQNPDKYPAGIWQEHKATWQAQKEWIKSIDVQNDFRQTRRQIAAIANAWVVDKNWWM